MPLPESNRDERRARGSLRLRRRRRHRPSSARMESFGGSTTYGSTSPLTRSSSIAGLRSDSLEDFAISAHPGTRWPGTGFAVGAAMVGSKPAKEGGPLTRMELDALFHPVPG